jgi:hypothetical protein
MVEPVRETVVRYRDGSRERIVPGRDRFSPDADLVRARPGAFRPCYGDSRAVATMRALYRAAERELLSGTTRATTTSRRGRLALPPLRVLG